VKRLSESFDRCSVGLVLYSKIKRKSPVRQVNKYIELGSRLSTKHSPGRRLPDTLRSVCAYAVMSRLSRETKKTRETGPVRVCVRANSK